MRKKLFALLVGILAITLLLTACAGVNLTLTFEVDGEAYATVTTSGQEAVQMPKDPVKEGYLFDGWYWDKDVWEKPFTVNSLLETPLTESMTVYAKWKEVEEEHDHSFGEWTVETAATCTAEGTEKRVCECGEEETRVIEKLPHSFGEWTVETAATCTAEGLEKSVCGICETEETRTTEKLPHSFGEWTVETDATCTAEGTEKRLCNVCDTEETQSIEKLPHSFGEWTVETPATCTAEGTEKRVCGVCDTEEIRTVAVIPHNFITKYDDTYHWTECFVGGEVKDKEEHNYANGVCTACGTAKETEGLAYNKIDGGYEVAGIGTAEGSNIVIPSTYEGEPVIKIGASAFSYCSNLVSIEIPKSVITIGSRAFEYCDNLERLDISDIAVWCEIEFDNYKANPLYYAKHLYLNREEVTELVIPKGVTSIGSNAFYNCNNLVSVVIPDSVTSIGWSAFYNCSSLVSIEIPDRITSIGEHAFSGCDAIETLTCPTTAIGYISKTNLKTVVLTSGDSIGSYAFSGCSNLVSVVIGNGVTSIDSSAFKGCSNLVSVVIGNGVTSIDSYAFSGCSSLESITLPFIGRSKEASGHEGVFGYIFGYERRSSFVTISGTTHQYDEMNSSRNGYYYYYYYIPTSLKIVVINDGSTSIGDRAFSNCYNLTSVEIGNGVTSIGPSAFSACRSLVSVEIPSSVTSIDSNAFSGCSSLKKIEVIEGNEYYSSQDGILYNKEKTKFIHIPKAIEGEVTIPSGITSIGSSAFSYCSSLESVVIPTSVTSIGDYAFYNCNNLVSVEIPSSVTSIGDYAFRNCSSLVSVDIPSSVTSIGKSAFEGCNSLTKVEISDIAAWCRIKFGDSYANPLNYANHLYLNGEEITELVIHEGVTSISSNAFYGCSSLKSIIIPSSVTSIGYNAFSGCSSLISIEIPSGVTSIGSSAFEGCSSLVSVEIPNSVTSIDSSAFYECSSLVSISIPFVGKNAKASGYEAVFGYIFGYTKSRDTSQISGATYQWNDGSNYYHYYIPASIKTVVITGSTSIGIDAFYNCSSLTSVVIHEGVTSIGIDAFYNCSSLTSVVIHEGVTSIGYNAFSGTGIWNNTAKNNVVYADKWAIGYKGEKSTVTNITLRADTVGIGSYAFRDCSSLVSIEIPKNVTIIGSQAFFGCRSLVSVEIPSSVTSIGDYAFYYCSSLQSIVYSGTKAEWIAIAKESKWNDSTGDYTVTCTDGTLTKEESKS